MWLYNFEFMFTMIYATEGEESFFPRLWGSKPPCLPFNFCVCHGDNKKCTFFQNPHMHTYTSSYIPFYFRYVREKFWYKTCEKMTFYVFLVYPSEHFTLCLWLQQVESCFSGVRSPVCPGSVINQDSKGSGPPSLFPWQTGWWVNTGQMMCLGFSFSRR